MSIYGFILCLECKQRRWIKDSDTPLDGDLDKSGRFFEEHRRHRLEYVHDADDDRTHNDDWAEFEENGVQE